MHFHSSEWSTRQVVAEGIESIRRYLLHGEKCSVKIAKKSTYELRIEMYHEICIHEIFDQFY